MVGQLKGSVCLTIGCSFHLLLLQCTPNLCPKFLSVQSSEPPRHKATVKQIMFPCFIVVFAIHVALQCIKTPSSAFMLQHSTRHPVNHPSQTHQKEKVFFGKIDGSCREGLLNKNTMEKWILQFMTNDSWLSGCGTAWYAAARCRRASDDASPSMACSTKLSETAIQPTGRQTDKPTNKGKPTPATSNQANYTSPAAI